MINDLGEVFSELNFLPFRQALFQPWEHDDGF